MIRPFQQNFHPVRRYVLQHWRSITIILIVISAGSATAASMTLRSNGQSSPTSIAAAKASIGPPESKTGPSTSPRLNPDPSKSPSPSPQAASATTAKAVATAKTSAAKGSKTSSQPPVGPSDPGLNFGIADGSIPWLGTTDLNTRLRGIRSLGVRWVRFDIEWSQVQPTSAASFTWAQYDPVVAALKANGLNGLAIIDYTPAWARVASCAAVSTKCSPNNPAAFAAFAGAAAARYAPQGIHTWEVWNEPNTTSFWLPSPDTSAYTQLLKQSYTAIKHSDSSSTVMIGGTSAYITAGGNISSADFLSGIYASGGKGYFDAVALHPYSRPFLPSFTGAWNAWQEMGNTVPSVRSIMTANGDSSKKIWISEYGAPTGGPGGEATNGMSISELNDDHETEALQAQTVTQAVSLYSSYSWTGPFFWYTYEDAGTSQTTNDNFYGLLRADGSQKPAYAAYKNAIASYK